MGLLTENGFRFKRVLVGSFVCLGRSFVTLCFVTLLDHTREFAPTFLNHGMCNTRELSTRAPTLVEGSVERSVGSWGESCVMFDEQPHREWGNWGEYDWGEGTRHPKPHHPARIPSSSTRTPEISLEPQNRNG